MSQMHTAFQGLIEANLEHKQIKGGIRISKGALAIGTKLISFPEYWDARTKVFRIGKREEGCVLVFWCSCVLEGIQF